MNKKQKPLDALEDEEEPSVNRIASSFFESTSIHGVGRLYKKSGLCRRFVWLTVCLTFTVWAVEQICVVAYDYSQYPKKIDQRVEEDTVVHFPAVTLCSLNSMPHSEYLQEHKWWRAFVELEDQYIEPKCDSRKFAPKKRLPNTFKKQSNSRHKRAGDTATGGSTDFPMSFEGNYYDDLEYMDYATYTFNCSAAEKCDATCGGFPCSDGYCIPIYWECDNMNDCADGEDESNCYTCPLGWYRCSSGNCISNHLLCDGWADCSDATDELMCDTCPQGWYRCSSGNCISKQWLCDGWADCSDAADELMCGGDALVCPKGFFNCTDACIRDIFRCDGEVDCAAAEDEAECDECQSGALQCRGGSCVGAPRVCDGVRDCADGDDEDDCPVNNSTALCPAGYLSCDNGTCYNGRFRCDGKMHCNDTTDEEDCFTDNELILEIHEARLRCSQYYRDLVKYLALPAAADASLGGDRVGCQNLGNETYHETSFWSPMCLTIVICDYYGCYSKDLKRYTEFVEHNQLCTTCGETSTNCWLPKWLDEYEFGKLSNDSLDLMLKKGEIPDFTDIADLHDCSPEERLNNSIPAEDIVYSCTFDNHRCNYTQFFTWMSDEYGTCYTFNSLFKGNDSKVKTTKRAGPKTGLKVALEIRKGVALLTPEVGVRVVIHDPRLLPALEEEGFSIGPGVSSVAVRRHKYERLGKPHGVCANDYGFDHPYMYSRKLCKQLCVEREFRERCGCFMGENPLYDSLETKPEQRCSFSDRVQALCTAIVSKSIEEESIQCDCPLPCSEMTYDAHVTTSQPNNLYYNILSDTRKELKSLCSNDSQMVSLLVYLDSKSYTVTEESPAYSWDTLLSNIGGSLGLFIGVSLISILEMIEMIIDFIVIGFRRCTGRGKKISQTSAAAWQGKIEVVERLIDRQHNRYEQLRKELIKDIINDLKQNNDESFSSTRVHPNSTADRGNLDASRVFSLVFLRDEQ